LADISRRITPGEDYFTGSEQHQMFVSCQMHTVFTQLITCPSTSRRLCVCGNHFNKTTRTVVASWHSFRTFINYLFASSFPWSF